MTITTEAWVLYKGDEPGVSALDAGEFRRERFSFPDLGDGEILVEPLFGCWEGNMGHAIGRRPIDVCVQRGEDRIVIGNAGVMRALAVGPGVTGISEGDIGALFCGHDLDPYGYATRIYGYDAPGSLGLMARRTKVRAHEFVPLPAADHVPLESWAAFSLRYVTAWANWRVAFAAYRLQMDERRDPHPYVLGWGGGCTLAELELARHHGCQVGMLSGDPGRLAALRGMGIEAFDRRDYPDIQFDEERYTIDDSYRQRYRESERAMLADVHAWTGGRGVAIFIDYIGAPVFRATLKALGRQGVITTAGWKRGMHTYSNRAIECIKRHVHVHTHYARREECDAAVAYAVDHDWTPEISEMYDWDDIPTLARNATRGALRTYFPSYRINAL